MKRWLMGLGLAVGLSASCLDDNRSAEHEQWSNWKVSCYMDSCVAHFGDRVLLCDATGCYCMGTDGGWKTLCHDAVELSPAGLKAVYHDGCWCT